MSDQKIHPWKVLTRTRDYKCPVWNVSRNEVISSDGQIKGSFYVTETRPWVNIIALDQNDNVIVVEQYRHGIEEVTMEIPGGVVDRSDESPLVSAQRELREETGYESNNWQHLGKISANPAIMNNWCDIYLAEDCRHLNHQQTDEFEEIAIHLIPRLTFLEYVLSDKIHHSLAVAAVCKWLLYKK